MGKVYLGIDPGSNGALALIYPDVQVRVFDFKDPKALTYLQFVANESWGTEPIAMVERQWTRPRFRPVDKLIISFGQWIGRLEALDVSFSCPTPQQWQKVMYRDASKIYKTVKGEKKLDTKAMSLTIARQLFPQLKESLTRKKDDGRADALLIAEYCKRLDQGVV